MSDKLYEQLGSILDGTGRYKLLDPHRKAVLALPANAFKLWMAYWMFESDDREAYPKRETLEKAMGMSKPTLLKARQYLIETGWLVKVDGSAGSRYTKPSTGSWNIGIYRVDDPSGKESLPLEPDAVKNVDHDAVKNSYRPQNLTGKECYPNVASAFAVASTGTTTVSSPATDTLATPHTPCVRESLAPPITSLREKEPAPSETKPEKQHPVSTPPITAPPPTLFNCPACDLTHCKGYYVAEHIEAEHPELGQQSFEIPCTVDGCYWRTWWNKISNNEAASAAELANHLEVQHNPDSPRFAPMDVCGNEGCYTVLPRSQMAEHRLTCKKATSEAA
jgi:hypothetical protein